MDKKINKASNFLSTANWVVFDDIIIKYIDINLTMQ